MRSSQPLAQPKDHKAKVCIWGDLTVADVDALYDVRSPEEVKRILANIFGLYHGSSLEPASLKDGILLDLYYYTIEFCIGHNLTKEQTSTFFSIIKRTHAINAETPFGNMENAFRFFRDMMLCHSVKRPPFSIELFSPDQVKLITEYAINTYFRHYNLYKYTFTPQVKLDIGIVYEGIEVPTPPATEEHEEETVTIEQPTEPEVIASPEPELTDRQKELKLLIEKQLEEEMQKLRASLEEHLKLSEDGLQKKLVIAESSSNGGSSKGGQRKKK